MLANRISFLSFVLSLFFPIFIQSYESTHAQEWAFLYADKMDSEELQLTANFLYILYANALVDTEIQKYYTPLAQLSQIARINLTDTSNPNNELLQLKALAEKLSFLVKARFIYTRLLYECINHCNENQTDIVEKALKDLQSHASDMLYEWAEDNNEAFAKQLEKMAKAIVDCEKSLHFASGLYTGLSNGELPFVVEDQDKPLAIMNVILQTTPTFMNTANTIANALNHIDNRAMATICFGTEVYKQHYQTVYNIMAQESFDKNYAITLFDAYGLPSEHNSLLPDAEHVFEHMLKVTQGLEHVSA